MSLLLAALVTLTWQPVTLYSNGSPLPTSAQYQVLRRNKEKGSEFRVVAIRKATNYQWSAQPGHWCFAVRATVGGVVGGRSRERCIRVVR